MSAFLSLLVPLDRLPLSVLFTFAAVGLSFLAWTFQTLYNDLPFAGFPVVALPGLSPKQSWVQKGIETVAEGTRQHTIFQVITGTGSRIILPNRFAEELKGNKDLDFRIVTAKEFFPNLSGFEPFALALSPDSHVIPEVIRTNLTQSLGLVIHDLVDETLKSVHDLLGENEQWHTIPAKVKLHSMVARLSSRVFLGEQLCRNDRWLKIAENYTIDVFMAARELRKIFPLFRPIAHRFMKYSNRIRRHYRDAQALILPEVQRRQERAQKAIAAGHKPPKIADTIGWLYEKTRGRPYDFVGAQLALTLAAVHTTTDALMEALADVCAFPELQQSLRDEVIHVLGQDGWSRTALYKMKLMDSFLKESQRVHPIAVATMIRQTLKPITLSDGTKIPGGAKLLFATRYSDPQLYPDADEFDARRFLRLRESSESQNSHQHVTTSSDHLAFGHGPYACPGRFFASNEIKVALSVLLLKYDWSFEGGQTLDSVCFHMEASVMTRPDVNLRIRRRKEEIPLDDLIGSLSVDVA